MPVGPSIILAVGAALDVFFLVAVFTAPAVRHFPRWGWALLCVCCSPLGGIAFLSLGRQRRT